MKHLTLMLCITSQLFGLIAMDAAAQPVYRSIDAGGNVTFSDEPLNDAVRSEAVRIPPRLSDLEVERARAEVASVVKRADELRRQRLLERQAQQARQAALWQPPPPVSTAPATATVGESHRHTNAHRRHHALPGFRRLPHHYLSLENPSNGDHPAFRSGRPRPQAMQPDLSQKVLPRGR